VNTVQVNNLSNPYVILHQNLKPELIGGALRVGLLALFQPEDQLQDALGIMNKVTLIGLTLSIAKIFAYNTWDPRDRIEATIKDGNYAMARATLVTYCFGKYAGFLGIIELPLLAMKLFALNEQNEREIKRANLSIKINRIVSLLF